jgi:ATP-dependent exoDNAse (exonuclease V) beta subunit
MKYLEKKNEHERDPHLSFDEKSHQYFVHGDKFISSTTLIHSYFSKFDADEIIDNMQKSPNWSNNKYYPLHKDEIKSIWSKNSESAIIQGTKLHQDIESYLNFELFSNESKEFQYFLNFFRENRINTYRTEWPIYDEESKIAGTIDCCCENNYGELILYDWKRSKEIKRRSDFKKKFALSDELSHLEDVNFNHYSLQLNLYKYILEKNYNKKVKEMYLAVFHPDNFNKNYIIVTIPDMKKEIEFIVKKRINAN